MIPEEKNQEKQGEMEQDQERESEFYSEIGRNKDRSGQENNPVNPNQPEEGGSR